MPLVRSIIFFRSFSRGGSPSSLQSWSRRVCATKASTWKTLRVSVNDKPIVGFDPDNGLLLMAFVAWISHTCAKSGHGQLESERSILEAYSTGTLATYFGFRDQPANEVLRVAFAQQFRTPCNRSKITGCLSF